MKKVRNNKVKKNNTKVIKTTLMDRINQEVKTFVDVDVLRIHNNYEENIFGGLV